MPEHRELKIRLSNSPFKVLAIQDSRVVKEIIEGRITPTSECYSEKLDDPIFLRAQNIEEGYLNLSDAKRLKREVFEADPKAILVDGDVVLTIDGVLLGIAAVHRVGEEDCCISNHLVRIQHGTEANPEFLVWLLNSSLGQKQIKLGITGSAIPGIRTDAIKRILIPLPQLEVQRSLVSELEAARESRKQKLAQADELLSRLDTYLLDQLGLALPEQSNHSVYAIRLNQIQSRIDPHSNHSRFRKLIQLLESHHLPVSKFSSVSLDIFSGTTPKARGDAYTNELDGVPFIRSGEITKDGSVVEDHAVFIKREVHEGLMQRSQLRQGDLLIAIVGATIGSVGVYNRSTPANINQAIASVRLNNSLVLPEFARWFLASPIGQAILDYLKRPVARANINLEEIGEILILIPQLEVQRSVIAQVEQSRIEMRQLQQEVETEWEAAKSRFERKLLGEAE